MSARQVAVREMRKHGQTVASELASAVRHLDAAQSPFADLLDAIDELEYEFDDAEKFAGLMQEATNKLREAQTLLSALPGAKLSVAGGGS